MHAMKTYVRVKFSLNSNHRTKMFKNYSFQIGEVFGEGKRKRISIFKKFHPLLLVSTTVLIL